MTTQGDEFVTRLEWAATLYEGRIYMRLMLDMGMMLVCGAVLYAQGSITTFSFEGNMEGWESDSLMPQSPCYATNGGYPECSGQPNLVVDRRASIQRSTEQAYDGAHSLRMFMDGFGGGGLAWIDRPFSGAPGARYRVDLVFYVWPPQTEINANPILAFAGAGRPSSNQFTVFKPGNATSQGGWSRYELVSEVVPDSTGTIWAAVGVGTSEGFTNMFVDSVTVSIVPVTVNTSTAVLGMVPNSGTNRSQAFTFSFSDAKGWQDLGVVNILINSSLSASNACYLAYVPSIDVLYLVNDTGTALLPGILLSGANTPPGFQASSAGLSNMQCSVSGSGSSVLKASADTLTLNLAITFSATFLGTQTFYLAARDISGSNIAGWSADGTWTLQ